MNASRDTMKEYNRASGETGRFFSDVEDLLKRVTNMNDADVARLRERVEGSLSSVRDTVTRNASRVRESAGEIADTTDAYVRRSPWTVAGIAMVAGLIVGAAVLSLRR